MRRHLDPVGATLDAKIQAFGRVLADGLRDDGEVNEALLLATALAAIEARSSWFSSSSLPNPSRLPS